MGFRLYLDPCGVWAESLPVGGLLDRVRGGRSLRLPTEPCVRIRTRLLMQGVSIEKHQTNALTFDQSVFPALSG